MQTHCFGLLVGMLDGNEGANCSPHGDKAKESEEEDRAYLPMT
jgi:hypothetical protein